MLSRLEVAELSRAQAAVRRGAQGAVRAVLADLSIEPGAAPYGQVSAAVEAVVRQWGDVAGELAASVVETQGGTAVLAAPDELAADFGRAFGWSLKPVRHGGITEATARLLTVTDELVLRHGDATTLASVRADGARWAWSPVGDTCAYCNLKASRGAVYWSESSARNDRHGGCDCAVIPVYDDEPLPYDEATYYDQYSAAAAAAGTTSLKPVLAQMRRMGFGH